jgi:hypothetical protein
VLPCLRLLLFDDEGGRALDLDHLDLRPFLERLAVEVRACRPLLAADADAAGRRVDAADDDRASPDERIGAGSRERRQVDMPPRERAQDAERRDGPRDEDEQRDRRSGAEEGGERCRRGECGPSRRRPPPLASRRWAASESARRA